jgi:uncharacterized membrane protein
MDRRYSPKLLSGSTWLYSGIFPQLDSCHHFLPYVCCRFIVFAVVPGLKETGLKDSLFRSALFGILTYGTYDLTNLALIEGWPVLVTVVDIIWGMILSIIVCMVSLKAGRHFNWR